MGIERSSRLTRRLLLGCFWLAAVGHAEPTSDATILGPSEQSARIDEFRLRLTSYYQDGHGYQSKAGTLAGPGSERTLIVQPMMLVGIRQTARIHHEVVVPLDIVSAASANALDVVSHASAVNEAIGIELTSRFELSDDDRLTSNLAWHEEEPFGSGSFGLGYSRSLADDNASLGISGQATFDRFDNLHPDGTRHGRRNRTALNGNLSFLQLLSPTTVFDASYGLTFQQGTLETTYNSVPVSGGASRSNELFPHTRTRHAVQARVAQHLPGSHTTLRASYRYYTDTFQLDAHTTEFELHQYLFPWLIARGSFRYYTQTGVNFFSTALPLQESPLSPRTADSDLAK
ncbi:MAG TPA: DUF3570 domain-containing protein, partial [Polyangiaceae bacterium]|nr:DUF3570 domain-containing protein [Polyangiaceae bacterium]